MQPHLFVDSRPPAVVGAALGDLGGAIGASLLVVRPALRTNRYTRSMSEVAGVVLAGGRSTRMGRPKANLEWHGSTLLHRVTGIVGRAVDGPVVVVRRARPGAAELPPGVRVVEDAAEGRGPLQGLAAGLAAVAGDAEVAYVSSTDVPLLHPAFVSGGRCERAARTGATAIRGRGTARRPRLQAPACRGLPHVAPGGGRGADRRGPDAAGVPVRAEPRARARARRICSRTPSLRPPTPSCSRF